MFIVQKQTKTYTHTQIMSITKQKILINVHPYHSTLCSFSKELSSNSSRIHNTKTNIQVPKANRKLKTEQWVLLELTVARALGLNTLTGQEGRPWARSGRGSELSTLKITGSWKAISSVQETLITQPIDPGK